MSLKKLLLLSASAAASLAASVSFAGGSDVSMPVAPVVDNGYYVEGHVGYAFQDYHNNVQWRLQPEFGTKSGANREGGFSGGIDMGYKINSHVAVELGWLHLPTVNVNATGEKADMESWVAYLAGKYIAQLCPKSNMFFKLGVAYRQVNMPANAVLSTAAVISKNKSDFVRPMFAVGVERMMNANFSAVMQYAYIMGANNSFPFTGSAGNGALSSLAAHVLTAGVSYSFTM